jgi:glutathione S-transferase
MAANDSAKVILYGAPMSLFSGKARAYLRKQHIAFDEMMPGSERCREQVFPAIKRRVLPVVELPGGQLIQDTVDIIDHFDSLPSRLYSVYPASPKQKIVSLILDLFGSEGLFKVAMHYRWSFPAENQGFLRGEFGDHVLPGGDQKSIAEIAERAMAPMRGYLPLMGVTVESIPVIEAQYDELLSLLNAHFAQHPYLIGGRPTVADYGLLGPLYAHLSRDPYPGAIMRNNAQRVYRWVERMNSPERDMPEYGDYSEKLFNDDALPDTLLNVLGLVGRDFLPELQETIKAVDAFLATQGASVAGQCVTPKPHIKMLGEMHYEFRGKTLKGMVVPYRLYMLQRITDAFAALSPIEQVACYDALNSVGLGSLLSLTASRRVERSNHIEVWGREIAAKDNAANGSSN